MRIKADVRPSTEARLGSVPCAQLESQLAGRNSASVFRQLNCFWRNTLTLLRQTSWSVQRFDFDDRGAVVAAHPETDWRRAVVDEHPPDVGRTRQ
jgi:hypothetical protein